MTTNKHDTMPPGFEAHAWAEHGPNAYAVTATEPVKAYGGALTIVRPGDLIGIFGYSEARSVAKAIAFHDEIENLASLLQTAGSWGENTPEQSLNWARDRVTEIASDPDVLVGLALLAREHLKGCRK